MTQVQLNTTVNTPNYMEQGGKKLVVGGDLQTPARTYTTSPQTLVSGNMPSLVAIGGGSPVTVNLPNPSTAEEGKVITFIAITQQAHVVSNSTGAGFNGGGASTDVATFAGLAAAERIAVVAINGVWWVTTLVGVTLG